MKDYYYILGVGKNASEEEIKKAYRKLSMKFHPDQNNNDKYWEERFKDINEAYETLVDYSKRRRYDEEFEEESSGQYFTASSAMPPSQGPPPKPPILKRIINVILNIFGFLIILGAIVRIGKGCDSDTGGKGSSLSESERPTRTLTFTRVRTKFYNKTLKAWSDWSQEVILKEPAKYTLTQLDDQNSKFKWMNGDSINNTVILTFKGYDSNNDWNEYVTEGGEVVDVRHATLNTLIQNGMGDSNVELYDWNYTQDVAYEMK